VVRFIKTVTEKRTGYFWNELSARTLSELIHRLNDYGRREGSVSGDVDHRVVYIGTEATCTENGINYRWVAVVETKFEYTAYITEISKEEKPK